MAPSPNPAPQPPTTTTTISTHLADPSLTPLRTTARSQPQLEALTSLTSTALTAHSTALRLGLGSLKRLVVEYPHPGPLILNSFLDPPSARKQHDRLSDALGDLDINALPSSSSSSPADDRAAEEAATTASIGTVADVGDAEDPPMLVAVIVGAGPEDGREAKRAAARLERVGRNFQREWVAEEMAAADRSD